MNCTQPSLRFRILVVLIVACVGCWENSSNTVVVYAALDREFSEPILKEFNQRIDPSLGKKQRMTAIAKYDVESTKTVGLTNALLAERRRPRCDLFWNNEILNTLRLAKAGLLRPLPDKISLGFPSWAQSPDRLWCGFAARARILLVNTDRLPQRETWPTRVADLADPRFRRDVCLAKPFFGTTATHMAVLFHRLGEIEAHRLFQGIADNVEITSGNKQSALSVGRGQFAWCLTDTDDALAEIRSGSPVEIVYPDQGTDESGTLLIPNTICVLKDAPHPAAADALARYLLSPETEKKLAESASGQIPLHAEASAFRPQMMPTDIRLMQVHFPATADRWESAVQALREAFHD